MTVKFKNTLAKGAFALLAIISANAANADLIIDNGEVNQTLLGTPAFSTSLLTPDGTLIQSPSAVVDNFTLTSTTNITKITFWTLESAGLGLFSDRISVAIFKNENNVMFSSPLWAAGGGLGQDAGESRPDPDSTGAPQIVKHELDVTGLELGAGDFLLHIGSAEGNGVTPPPPPMQGVPPIPQIPGPQGIPVAWLASSFTPGPGAQGNQFNMNGIGLAPSQGGELNLAFTIEGTVVEANAPATLALISLSLAGLLLRRKVS
jgi:hypothetical protein